MNNTVELKEILLKKINEKAKEDLSCEELQQLCSAWERLANGDYMEKLLSKDYATGITTAHN